MLKTDTLYVIADFDGTTYGRTPDGVGMYWYNEDQYEEAVGDVEPVRATRHFYSQVEFNAWRDGLDRA